ncbi:acyl carrier protein [Streptomyces aquilus]|uniref:acyl carrier protein n=1 Tax=Streptomyces aquilus TaxID=2548456 RepID=UPI0036B34776
MTATQQREEITEKLLAFVRENFLSGDPEGELTADTPLLELGILNSLNTATLIAHIHEEFGVRVPLGDVTPETFKNLENLGSLVHERWNAAHA